jgi:hypothetical protein
MGGLTPAQQMSFKCFIACKKAATKAGLVAVARDKDAKSLFTGDRRFRPRDRLKR